MVFCSFSMMGNVDARHVDIFDIISIKVLTVTKGPVCCRLEGGKQSTFRHRVTKENQNATRRTYLRRLQHWTVGVVAFGCPDRQAEATVSGSKGEERK